MDDESGVTQKDRAIDKLYKKISYSTSYRITIGSNLAARLPGTCKEQRRLALTGKQ